ncbi:MAG: LytR C-terminal domain-containing protein [Longimicrobiaceae bacterium]
MPRSRAKRGSGASAPRGRGGKGGAKAGRWQALGLFVTLLAVTVLGGSLVFGIWQTYFRGPAPSTPAPMAGAPRVAAPAGRVRVQVLNATGTQGLARRATDVLRDRGYDVLEMGNAPRGTNPGMSVVYDRVGSLEAARGVGQALGIARVETRRDPSLLLEVTVVLGSDWKGPVDAN